MSKYVLTGTLRNGKRFKPIHTDTPWNYNLWRGTCWELDKEGKRHKVYSVWN